MALFIKVRTTVPRERKFVEAGPAASWLWAAGICYCRAGATDGFIPDVVMDTLVPRFTGRPLKRAIEALVRVRLFEPVDGGYLIHDYLDENPSRAQIDEMRDRDKHRKRDERVRGRDEGVHPDNDAVTNGTLRARVISHSVSDSPSVGVGLSEESARETTRPIGWHEAYHRKNCPPWALKSACQRGYCIPRYLWPQWEQRIGGPYEALSRSLAMFCEQVMAQTPPAKGDRPEQFWPAQFEAHFGTSLAVQPKPGKGARAVSAIDAAAAQLRGQT